MDKQEKCQELDGVGRWVQGMRAFVRRMDKQQGPTG